MKKLAVLAMLSVSGLALSAQAARADYTLNILHINDWHSRIESNNKYESTCSSEEEGKGECIGGAARLVTAIAAEREKLKGQNVLLLNGGDNFQGSLFYSTYKGKVEAEFLNGMRFDAMTVGNHEFDDGEDALAPFLDVIRFPVLSANVQAKAAAKVGDRIKPSVVLTVGGERIGIVGAVTTETPEIATPGPNITITDDIAAITAEVKKIQAAGVNKIVALTHVGYPRDKEMIARIPGVDVVVGGHTHSLLSNTDPKAEGPYPTMVDNPDGTQVPVTQAASYSKYLGAFKVVFDDRGVVKSAAGDPIFLDKAIKPDEAVLARIKELGAPIEALKQTVVGETLGPVDGSRDSCRARECAMGNLVSDAVLDRVKGQGVSIVFTNGGGLRASVDAGPVNMGEVLTVLPFQNTIATFQLTGRDVVAALENGVSQLEEKAGRFAQVAGLRYAFDPSAPAGSRVRDVFVRENSRWVPIDPAKTYLAATNNYVRQGGDGYHVFADNAKNAYDYGPGLEQVVADYLGAHNPYTPRLYGRIREIAGPAPVQPAPANAQAATPVQPAPAEPAPAATEAPVASGAQAPLPQLPAGSTEIVAQAPSVTTGGTAGADAAASAQPLPAEVPTVRAPAAGTSTAAAPAAPAPAETTPAPETGTGTAPAQPATPATPTTPEQPAATPAPATEADPATAPAGAQAPAAASATDPVPPASGPDAAAVPAAPAAGSDTPAAEAPATSESATAPVAPASGTEALPEAPAAPAEAPAAAPSQTLTEAPAAGTEGATTPVPPASGPDAAAVPAAPEPAPDVTAPAAPVEAPATAPAQTEAPAAGTESATTPVPPASGPDAVAVPEAPAAQATGTDAVPAAPAQPEQPAAGTAGTEGAATPVPPASGPDATAVPVAPEQVPAADAPAAVLPQTEADVPAAGTESATTPVPPASGPDAAAVPASPAQEPAAEVPAGTESATTPVPPASGPDASALPAAPEPAPGTASPAQPEAPPPAAESATTPVPPASGPDAVPAPAPPAAETPAPEQPATPATEAEGATPPAQPSPAPAAAPAPAAPAGTSHVVAAGDTFWDLAERFYRDGFQWPRIAEANPAQKELDLTVGATLTIPPAP